jgi:AAA domain
VTVPLIAARHDQLVAALIETTNLDQVPLVTELVAGILMTDSLAFLQGRPGCCKSFVALDMAGCVATGLPWQGKVAKKGTVLYVVAEGAGGLKRRVRAWEDSRGMLMYGVRFLPVPVQILSPIEGAAFAQLCEELNPALIVIDTQARTSIGLNENSAQEMGNYIGAVEAIREATGACVLVVHHEGRAGEHMRGSTALDGAAQTILKCAKEERLVTVSVVKQKDDEELPPLEMLVTPSVQSIVLNPLRRTWSNNTPVRPTALMRKISAALAKADDPLSLRGVLDRVEARTESIRQAMACLVDAGYVSTARGPRGATLHTLLNPFNEVDAP